MTHDHDMRCQSFTHWYLAYQDSVDFRTMSYQKWIENHSAHPEALPYSRSTHKQPIQTLAVMGIGSFGNAD